MRGFSYFTRRLAVGASCALCAAAPAWGADHSLGVTARIAATCSFTEASAYLLFPEIDPSGTATYITSTSVRVRCTSGTRLSLRVGGATQPPLLRQMTSLGFISRTETALPYRLDWSTGPETTGGFSPSAQDYVVTVTGTLLPAHYQDAADGHFTDLVTLELIP